MLGRFQRYLERFEEADTGRLCVTTREYLLQGARAQRAHSERKSFKLNHTERSKESTNIRPGKSTKQRQAENKSEEIEEYSNFGGH